MIIDPRTEGSLSVKLPKELINSDGLVAGSNEDDFFVLINGEETEFSEIKTESHRIISVNVPLGYEEIILISTLATKQETEIND